MRAVEVVVTVAARNPLAGDLDRVLQQSGAVFEELRGARVFITGGTGFFGRWLLETLLWANDQRQLGVSVGVLTRDDVAFADAAPHLARDRAVTLHKGDVRRFDADGRFTHVVHAATTSGARVQPAEMFDTIVTGTRQALAFTRRAGARRFLLTSSGAVYGRQPSEISHVAEEYGGAPDATQPSSAYAEGKRAAETLCAVSADGELTPTIARCFAFVGPHLPLDAHFAVGNFIRDGLTGGPIRVAGDGTPFRSYLFAADLAAWLWTILIKGEPLRAYNVGSEEAISIADLARTVAGRFSPSPDVHVAKTPVAWNAAERYVPSTARARRELGLSETVSLSDALDRTIRWHRERIGDTAAGPSVSAVERGRTR